MTAGTPKQEAIKYLVCPDFSEEAKAAFLEYAEFLADIFPLPANPISGEYAANFEAALVAENEKEVAAAALLYFISAMPPKTAQWLKEAIENGKTAQIETIDGQTTIFDFLPTRADQRKAAMQDMEKTVVQSMADTLQAEIEANKYDVLPTSPALYLFNAAISHHSKEKVIPTTKNGTKQSDRHKTVEYIQQQGGYTLAQTDKRTGERVEITLVNAEKMRGKGVKKCFAFLLTQCNKQNFSPVFDFSLQELVDRGMYSSVANARRGMVNAMDTIQSIRFKGVIRKGKRKVIDQARSVVLFPTMDIEKNRAFVRVNPDVNMEFIAPYYALIPQFAYSLNNNAFDLCEYIFMQARQNTEAIKKSGSFNISFKKIRELLVLPLEEDITSRGGKWKPKQYVIEPILEAIKEITERAQAVNHTEFTIDTTYNPNYKNLGDFMEGYITIKFTGDIYGKFSQLAEKQEAKRAQAIARQEKKALAEPKPKAAP